MTTRPQDNLDVAEHAVSGPPIVQMDEPGVGETLVWRVVSTEMFAAPVEQSPSEVSVCRPPELAAQFRARAAARPFLSEAWPAPPHVAQPRVQGAVEPRLPMVLRLPGPASDVRLADLRLDDLP
jgi:hypothetical protein